MKRDEKFQKSRDTSTVKYVRFDLLSILVCTRLLTEQILDFIRKLMMIFKTLLVKNGIRTL